METRSGRYPRVHPSVLVVEEDNALRPVLADVFEDDNLEVMTAGTRERAAYILFESSHPVGVLVLDVGLGEEGEGAELLAQVATMERPPATVLVSALRSRVEPLATKYGVPFLLKPFDLGVFHASVVTALENGIRPHDRVA